MLRIMQALAIVLIITPPRMQHVHPQMKTVLIPQTKISTLTVYGDQQSGSDDGSQLVSQASFSSNRVDNYAAAYDEMTSSRIHRSKI